MATYIKFLAGDYGKEEYIYIKNKNQLRCSSKMFGAKELFLSSIASCEVANEVGGVLLGGIGAVAGAVAGGKTTESTVIIEFKNGNKALAKVNSSMMEVIRAYLFDDQLAQERGEPNPLIHHERSQTPPKKIALIIGVLITVVLAVLWLSCALQTPPNTNGALLWGILTILSGLYSWKTYKKIYKS